MSDLADVLPCKSLSELMPEPCHVRWNFEELSGVELCQLLTPSQVCTLHQMVGMSRCIQLLS